MTGETNESLEEILFDLAVQRPTAADRAAFLDNVCRENPSLRATLERLLSVHFGQAGFLPKRSASPARLDSIPALATPPQEKPAQVIGRYKLLEKIGEGGFGEVWMAEQREPVKRRVAFKIIKLGMDSRQIVARFEAERQALALMDHENIARIFDADVTDTGRPYFVMELVRGARLTEYCDQNKLPTAARLALFVKVCRAIQHAHQKGIIHRDIKPSNILVTLHDGVPVPKVIDFGIAKAMQGELTDKTVFTQFAQFIGTPAYISPEQTETSGLDIDTRSDIYSLGVLLYELLVGRTPFDPAEMVKGGLEGLRQIVREKEPVKPSTRLKTLPAAELTSTAQRRQTEALKLAHQLRGDLDWIVLKCLAKDRTRRYETANGLAMDVQRYLASEPIVARPPSAAYKLRKAWQRHQWTFTAGAVVAVALVLGIGLSTWQAIRATRAERLASRRLLEVVAERDAKQEAKAELEARNLDLRWAFYKSALQSANAALEHDDPEAVRAALDQCEPDLRGWEWNHLNLRAPLVRRIPGPVAVGAFLTRDGARIVSVGQDSTLRVWDAQRGTQLSRFPLPKGASAAPTPSPVALSPDERSVAIGGTNGMLGVYDVATGAARWEAQTGAGGLSGLAFAADGSRLASAGWDGEVILWDRGGRPVRTNYLAGGVRNLAFSPDGRTLLAGGVKRSARLLAADTLELVGQLDAGPGGQPCVAFSPDGQRIVSGDADGFARVWDTARGQVLTRTAVSHLKDLGPDFGKRVVSNVTAVAFSPDGRAFATAAEDQVVRVWDAASGQRLDQFPTKAVLPGFMPMVQFSADGGQLLSVGGYNDAGLRLWSLHHGRQAALTSGHSDTIWSAAFTPDSQQLLSGGWDRLLRLSRADDGSEVRAFRGHTNIVWSVAVSADGRRAVSGSQDGTVRYWDLQTARCLRVIPVQPAPVGSQSDFTLFVALSPDGRQVVSGGCDGRVLVWDLDTGARLWAVSSHIEPVWSIAWSADGRRIAVGRTGGRLTMIDAVNHAEMWHTNYHTSYVVSLAFRPDGQQILSANLTGELSLSQTQSGRLLQRIGTEIGWIRSVAFSPDGRRMASAGDDGVVRLWESESWNLLLLMPRESVRILSVAFSPDGKRLAAARNDGKARVWQTEPSPPPR